MKKDRPAHLRVVETPEPARPVQAYDFGLPQSQATLFVSKNPALLIFVSIETIEEADVLPLFVNASPKIIVDLRLAPRFDFGSITRRFMLSLFDTIGARYVALSANYGTKSFREIVSDDEKLGAAISKALSRDNRPAVGPVMLLLDGSQASNGSIEPVARTITPPSSSGWELLRVPQSARTAVDPDRTVLFISHATPEDNEFATWLAVQLRILGYDVWTDFGELRGGDVFWDQIEGIIRNRTAKFIAVLSTTSQTKHGVLDEVNIAVSLERTQGFANFVIPCRIDKLPFSDVRANLARKNIIDFSQNWSAGLRLLTETFQRDGTPKFISAAAADTIKKAVEAKDNLQNVPETILLNWVEMLAYPNAISFYQVIRGSHLLLDLLSQKLPSTSYQNGILSFATPTDIAENSSNGLVLKRTCSVSTAEFLKGRPAELPGLSRLAARNAFSSLTRQAWSTMMRRRGFQGYELASKTTSWFAPVGFSSTNRVNFLDVKGKKRQKALVGYSAKRGVYWHFAIDARLAQGYPLRLTMKPHVVFTMDGKTPLESPARMHVLRRGFCRSWWNDRWRDLTAALLAHLAGDEGLIKLEVGTGATFRLAGELMKGAIDTSPQVVSATFDLEADEIDPIDEELDEEEVNDLIIVQDTTNVSSDSDEDV